MKGGTLEPRISGRDLKWKGTSNPSSYHGIEKFEKFDSYLLTIFFELGLRNFSKLFLKALKLGGLQKLRSSLFHSAAVGWKKCFQKS